MNAVKNITEKNWFWRIIVFLVILIGLLTDKYDPNGFVYGAGY